jgi:hypothetical protein
MDRDGTREGYDLELTRSVAERVSIPVVASGGVGSLEHLFAGLLDGRADAAPRGIDLSRRRSHDWRGQGFLAGRVFVCGYWRRSWSHRSGRMTTMGVKVSEIMDAARRGRASRPGDRGLPRSCGRRAGFSDTDVARREPLRAGRGGWPSGGGPIAPFEPARSGTIAARSLAKVARGGERPRAGAQRRGQRRSQRKRGGARRRARVGPHSGEPIGRRASALEARARRDSRANPGGRISSTRPGEARRSAPTDAAPTTLRSPPSGVRRGGDDTERFRCLVQPPSTLAMRPSRSTTTSRGAGRASGARGAVPLRAQQYRGRR